MSTNPPASGSPDSSSGPPSPSSLQRCRGCLAAQLPTIALILVVGIPIGRAVPALLSLAVRGEWKPAAAALLALGMLAAPAPTLQLVRSLIPTRKD